MPAIRQVQGRGWCPKTITTSVGLADKAAGGQIHLPTVSNTINSEPTNIDGQTMKSRMGVARVLRAQWSIAISRTAVVVCNFATFWGPSL